MFGKPVALVSPIFNVARQIHRACNRGARALACSHSYKVQDRNSYFNAHILLDESIG